MTKREQAYRAGCGVSESTGEGPADFSAPQMTYDLARPQVSRATACVFSTCVWYYQCFYNNNCGLERD